MKSSVVTSYFEMMISAADSCIAAVFVVLAFDPVSVAALMVLVVEHLIVVEYLHQADSFLIIYFINFAQKRFIEIQIANIIQIIF